MVYLAWNIYKEYFEFWNNSLSIKLPIDLQHTFRKVNRTTDTSMLQ